MNVAVTAASGKLGSAIIRKLVKQIGKKNVIGIARNPNKAGHFGVEIRKGDYNNKSDFELALLDIDILLLVSGMDAPEKRIGQHRNVINAAKETGVKKIVYTSIIGKEGDTTFDPVIRSNRQTENDIQKSGLQWSIGRNGLYIEPDIEAIEDYKKAGEIANCAGDGLASYTTREELAQAYSQMILHDDRNNQLFNLTGKPITQSQLVAFMNQSFKTNLRYREMSPDDYLKFQQKVNGEFLGAIIAGIYEKIRNGEFVADSNYTNAAGREHMSWGKYFEQLK